MAFLRLSDFLSGAIGSIAFYALCYLYWQLTVGASRRALIKQHGCKPIREYPELNSFPENIIGLKQIRASVTAFKEHRYLELMNDRYTKYQKTFHFKTLHVDMIYTIEPENLKAMMATKFKDFSLPTRRSFAVGPLLGEGIFVTNGDKWQHSRNLLRPSFNRSQVGDLAIFELHVAQLIKAIPTDGSTVDLQDLFFQLTIDSATQFLFGESTNVLAGTDDFKLRFTEAFNRSQEEIARGFRSGKIHPFFRSKQFKQDVKYVHDFVDRYVQKGLAHRAKSLQQQGNSEKSSGSEGEEGRYVFLHELCKATSDPVQIRSELLNILLAGRDTTASLLSSVFFILARRPDVWAKLMAEVAALGGEAPTYAQVKEMRYLKMVLNETLRLYPPVPLNGRMSTTDTVLPLGGGPDGTAPLFLPRNTIVQWSLYSMHRRQDFYGADAEEFRPERWAEGLRPGWEYLPFNGGPRICIGQGFALMEGGYTAVRVLQGVFAEEGRRMEVRDGRGWMEGMTLTCAISQGVKVGIVGGE